jgi:preprotein translocase subunit SecY
MNSEELISQQTAEEKSLIEKISKYIPAIEKPAYKQSFNTRLKWTGVALALFLTLSHIPLIGLGETGPQAEYLRTISTLLGARYGSILTLGIGPIVTAGIILQLLVGSKILNWEMTKPENRKKFQFWNKFLAIIFSFIEAVAYILTGALPLAAPEFFAIVTLQLAVGGIFVILLDELTSKWGFGSGISLFIAAGVGSQIFIRIFSPLPVTCSAFNFAACIPNEANPPVGLLWGTTIALTAGRTVEALFNFFPIFATAIIFLIAIYVQGIHIDVPLVFSALRGFGRSWSLKLLYTSNIPVILTAALLANLQLMARVGASPAGNLLCGPLGCFDQSGSPVSGLIYFFSLHSRGFLFQLLTGAAVPLEILRMITYTLFVVIFATIFSVFWVNTAGMDAKSVAQQIESIGLQIPGYRRDPRIVESVLNRYIPALAVLGGAAVGLLASFADILGAVGTGTGILLTVMIIYNYYEELRNQNLDEAHPIIRKLLGG